MDFSTSRSFLRLVWRVYPDCRLSGSVGFILDNRVSYTMDLKKP